MYKGHSDRIVIAQEEVKKEAEQEKEKDKQEKINKALDDLLQ